MDGHIITCNRMNLLCLTMNCLREAFPNNNFECRTVFQVEAVWQISCTDHDLGGWYSNNKDNIKMMQSIAKTVIVSREEK